MNLLSLFKDLSLHPKNAEELKGLILQLAIQGKLTAKWREENPDVEPASKLLKRIKDEKERLFAERKIRKENPILPIQDKEKPFVLPKGWEWCRMLDFCKLITDGTHHTPKYEDTGIPFLSVKDMSKGFLDFSNTRFVSLKTHKELIKRCYPQKDDVLLTKVGTTGIAISIDREIEFSIFVSVSLLKIFPDEIYSKYIEQCINSPLVKKQSDEGTEGVGNKNLVLRKIRAFLIPIPPLQEQKAIVKIVNQLFAEVEQLEVLTKERIQLKQDFATSALERLIQANDTQNEWQFLQKHFYSFFTEKSSVKKLRETILQLAVQGKLTAKWRNANPDIEPASELLKRIKAEKEKLIKEKKIKKEKPLPAIEDKEKPFELPVGWEWCRLGEVGLLERGKSKHRPRNDNRLFKNGKYPLVQTGDVSAAKTTAGKITTNKSWYNEFGLAQSRIWQVDTLCITIAANIAETGFLSFEACFPDSVVGFTEIVSTENSLSKYVESFITITKSDLERFAPSTAQKNINLGILNELKFPFPPQSEQTAIIEKVNTLMSLCDELEQQIDNSQTQIEQLMQSCLREVFE